MNEKQRRFAEQYAKHGNAAQAAREAGYSPTRAKRTGSELLKRPDVARLVAKLQGETAEKLGIDQEWLAERYVRFVDGALRGDYPGTVGPRALEGLSRLLGMGRDAVSDDRPVVFILRDPDEPRDPDAPVYTLDLGRDLADEDYDPDDD